MAEDKPTVERRKLNGDRVEVNRWVMVVTYFFCWLFAAALIVFEFTGYLTYRPLLVALSIYLIFWPIYQVSPSELLRKVFPSG